VTRPPLSILYGERWPTRVFSILWNHSQSGSKETDFSLHTEPHNQLAIHRQTSLATRLGMHGVDLEKSWHCPLFGGRTSNVGTRIMISFRVAGYGFSLPPRLLSLHLFESELWTIGWATVVEGQKHSHPTSCCCYSLCYCLALLTAQVQVLASHLFTIYCLKIYLH
jgi:hypothetical protein